MRQRPYPNSSLKSYLERLEIEARRGDTLSNALIKDILYLFQNRIQVSNRVGSIFFICDQSDLEAGFHFGIGILEVSSEPLVRQGLQWMTDEKSRAEGRQQLLTSLNEIEWYEFETGKSIVTL